MNPMSKLSPRATTMIQMDHTHVMATFHKYEIDASVSAKRAIVDTICLALEIHAQLEEEIFYPAMDELDAKEVARSVPEHDEMKRLVAVLRSMDPSEKSFDETFMTLMRNVIQHVAHEETVLLPQAERLIPERLSELGARMTKRRLELVAPKAGEIAINTARTFPGAMVAGAGVLVVGALLAGRALAASSRASAAGRSH